MNTNDTMRVFSTMVTPEMAEKYLAMNTANRPMDKNRVATYAKLITEDKWGKSNDAVCISKDQVILNGQHRLAAIVRAGKPAFLTFLTIFLDMDNEDKFRMDTGKSRTAGDYLVLDGLTRGKALASVVKTYVTIKNKKAVLRRSGGSKGAAHLLVTPLEVKDIFEKHSETFIDLEEQGRIFTTPGHLLGSAVVAAMMAHLIIDKRHDEGVVKSFFRQVCSLETSKNNTINMVRRFLISNKGSKEKTGAYVQAIVTKGWNYFVQGKELKVVRLMPGEEVEFI